MQSLAILHWDFLGLESCVYDLPTEHSARIHSSHMWAYSLFSNIFEGRAMRRHFEMEGRALAFLIRHCLTHFRLEEYLQLGCRVSQADG